jgi:hypothetical protein
MSKTTLPQYPIIRLLIAALFTSVPFSIQAGDAKPTQLGGGDLWDGFNYRFEALGYGIDRKLVEGSDLNSNNILGFSSQQATAQLRMDLSYKYEGLYVAIKPRYDWTWEKWSFGLRDGETETVASGYMQEWLVRLGRNNRLFASYGLENLQWGPSFLVSPSNPFIENNGKSNPFLEVPGLKYARLTWVADASWTAQAIANVGEGRLETFGPFRNVYAGKLDFVGAGRYGSLILSQRDTGPVTLGGYAGMTLSDSFLTHAEAMVDEDGDGAVLLGGSYTFSDGSTLVLEYLHNGSGCLQSEVRNCFRPLGESNPDDILVRSNYGFAQYFKNEFLIRPLELSLRGTFNLDDGSSVLTGIIDYDFNDNVELFTVVDWYFGAEGDEFGSLFNRSIMAGILLAY